MKRRRLFIGVVFLSAMFLAAFGKLSVAGCPGPISSAGVTVQAQCSSYAIEYAVWAGLLALVGILMLRFWASESR